MCYIELLIDDRIVKIPKGNFTFMYMLTDEEIFEEFFKAEKNLRVDYELFSVYIRRAFEAFVTFEEGKSRCKKAGKDTHDTEILNQYINAVKSEARDNDISLKTTLYRLCQDRRNMENVLVQFRTLSGYSEVKTVRDYIDYVYKFCSQNIHAAGGEEQHLIINRKNCMSLVQSFHHFLQSYYRINYVPYDKRLIPIEDYIPVVKEYDSGIELLNSLSLEEDKDIYVRDAYGGPKYYLLFTGDETLNRNRREIQTLYKLTEMNVHSPSNIISFRQKIENQQKDGYTCTVYKLPGFPHSLNNEFLCDLSSKEKLDIAEGLCNAVKTLHTYKNPLYHRNINPDAVIISNVEGIYVPVIFEFNVVKDDSEQWTVIKNADKQNKKEKNKYFVAPEVQRAEKSIKREWTHEWEKADIYSLGKLLIYIMNSGRVIETEDYEVLRQAVYEIVAKDNNPEKTVWGSSKLKNSDLDIENIQENVSVKKKFADCIVEMISENPEERPDIKKVVKCIEEVV